MPRGVIVVGNSTWRISAETNRQTRYKIAKEIDELHDAIKSGNVQLAEFILGEFGDMLLDADIVYGEVM